MLNSHRLLFLQQTVLHLSPKIMSSSETVIKWDAMLFLVPRMILNSQGHFKLHEPIKMSKNYYPLN